MTTQRELKAALAARDDAVKQAQQHAMEARTQRGMVLDILRYFGCPEEDWRALELIKAATQPVEAQQHAPEHQKCKVRISTISRAVTGVFLEGYPYEIELKSEKLVEAMASGPAQANARPYFDYSDEAAAVEAAKTLSMVGVPLNESGAIALMYAFVKLRGKQHAQAAQFNSREFDGIATTQEIRAVASSPEIPHSSIAQAALSDENCDNAAQRHLNAKAFSRYLNGDPVKLDAITIRQIVESASQPPAEAPAAPAFPARDNTLAAEQQGIFEKFAVRRNDGSDAPGGKHHGCAYFVLDLDHDQHASAAMIAYAASCRVTHPQLAADIVTRYLAAPAIEPMEDPVTVPRGLLGAACHAIVNKKDAPNTLEKLRSFILAKGPAEPAAQVQQRAAIPDYGVERPELLHALYRAFQRGDSVERAHAAICKILAAPAPAPVQPAPVADPEQTFSEKLHAEYAPRAILAVEPEPFILGNQYRTQGGRMVRFIGIANEGNSYETMSDELGHHRYTRRDFGRGTGAPWDDDCIPPLYTYPAIQPSPAQGDALSKQAERDLIVARAIRDAIFCTGNPCETDSDLICALAAKPSEAK